jgi:hypothetical protein
MYVGAYNLGGTTTSPLAGNIQALAVYARTLSPAEVWTASRQMQYCDVNDEWSAWARRRQWYYGPQVVAAAGRVGPIAGTLAEVRQMGGGMVALRQTGGTLVTERQVTAGVAHVIE